MASSAIGREQKLKINQVVVHPLVLLSVVDHYTRVAERTNSRVVGILLGELSKGKLDITNSYAVPFDEDRKNPIIWHFDHNYHENMYAMFKKVNAKEKICGWYSTGPKIKPSDLEINEVIRRYTSEPVLCIIDVKPKDELEIPTEAYISVENLPEDKSKSRRTFVHVSSEVGAYEAEEVGVEHLLRNIRDMTISTVADRVQAKLLSLKGMQKRILEMERYLDNVIAGKLPVNHQVIYNLQDVFNLLPDLKKKEMINAFSVKNNDNMLVIYLSSLIRSIIALHNLINNKLENKALELKAESGEKDKKEAKAKQDKDKEEKKKEGKEDEKKKEKD